MILFSKLECVHIYQGFPVIPGRNMIPDSIGRKIMADAGFLASQSSAELAPLVFGKLIIEVKPAPEEAQEAAPVDTGKGKPGPKPSKPKTPPGGLFETGVSNLEEADALKAVKTATVVDQLQAIAVNDARDMVKEAAILRIQQLANEAAAGAGGAGA